LKRTKRRYLALGLELDGAVDSKELMNAIWGAILKLYGEYGASLAGISLIECDAAKKLAVLRTSNASINMVRTALASMTKIGDKSAAVHVLTVSGTIKALRKKSKL